MATHTSRHPGTPITASATIPEIHQALRWSRC